MKKFTVILLSLLCVFSAAGITACAKDKDTAGKTFTFYVPDGAPALAVAEFINNNEKFGTDAEFDYNVVSADKIGSFINGAGGYGDFVILPVNAASKLYSANKDDPYKMVSVVTHGNLFIMSGEENLSLESLKGKVLGVIGQGLVPDLTLRSALAKAGLASDIEAGETAAEGKITLRYFTAPTEMIPLLKQGKLAYGLLPEPAATNLEKMTPEKTWQRASLQELYDDEKKEYPQAVLMAKSSVINDYPNLIESISEQFAGNIEWTKRHSADAARAINANIADKNPGLTPSLKPENLTKEAVLGCNIRWQSAASAKAEVKAYLKDIIDVGVGLEIPPAKQVGDDFFMLEA